MSYKVLHIIDCYLPETMNWLEALWHCSREKCRHFIHAEYYIKKPVDQFTFYTIGKIKNYPLAVFEKIQLKLQLSSRIKSIKRIVLQEQIDRIHVHFGPMAVRYYQLLMELNIPVSISIYGFDLEHLIFKKPETKSIYLSLAKSGAEFIVEGNYSKKILMSYGIAADKIRIVHMIFDRGFNPAVQRYSGPIRLLQAASFTEKKNQLGFIEALSERHASKFSIRLIGEAADPKYYKEVNKLIKIKAQHQIEQRNKLSLQDYLREVQNTHFSVQYSITSKTKDSEAGIPVFIKDSLSLARPVLSSIHCDIPEIIVHGFNGFLVPEMDTRAIAEQLDLLLVLSQQDYLRLSKNAFESVKINIENNLTANDLYSAYGL